MYRDETSINVLVFQHKQREIVSISSRADCSFIVPMPGSQVQLAKAGEIPRSWQVDNSPPSYAYLGTSLVVAVEVTPLTD